MFFANEVDEAHLFGVGVDVSEDLTVGDGAHFLELLEKVVVGHLGGQVAHENAARLKELGLKFGVASLEGLVPVLGLVNGCSCIAH